MSLIPTATDWKAKLHGPISSPYFSEMASRNVEYNEENKSAEKWTTDCAVSRWCCHLGYCWYAVIRPRVIKPWNASSHAVAFVKPPGRHHPILILEKLCNCPIHLLEKYQAAPSDTCHHWRILIIFHIDLHLWRFSQPGSPLTLPPLF